jgi:hypothetical protein
VKTKGRPVPSLQDKKIQDLINMLRAGHYLDRAARISNISPSTVYWWITEGETQRNRAEQNEELSDRDKAYIEIADEIRMAKEHAAHRAMVSIQKAAQDGTWQAAAWYLERTDPKNYAKTTQITGKDNGPVRLSITAEEVNELLKEISQENDTTDK